MISVIICTYNRDRMFEETVRSFLDCRTDSIDHELLLLDNNSTDKTREIGMGFAARFPWIRYINEPIQGHPYTKNRGIRESRGEIVAFLDDDVYLSSGWLTALVSSFERHPDVACIGGRVVPHFETDRPKWLEDGMLIIYGITEFGENEREIRPPEVPIGCNMAFRREVFEQIGDFPTSLGRKPGNLLSNDENYFLLCAAKAGLKTFYSPDAKVSHRIPPIRTSRNWILRRWYWQGISEIAMKQIGEDSLPRGVLAKHTIKTFLALLRQWQDVAGTLNAQCGRGGDTPIQKQIQLCYQLGTLRQSVAESIVIPNRKEVDK